MCFEKITVHLPVSRGTFGIAAYDNGVDSNFFKKMVDYLKKALIYGHTSRISS